MIPKKLWRYVIGQPGTQRRVTTVRTAERDPFGPPPGLPKDELFKRAREYDADRRQLADGAQANV